MEVPDQSKLEAARVKNREKYRAYYAANKEKVLEKKKAVRKIYYDNNREIECLRSAIRYYKRKGDTDQVSVLMDELEDYLEARERENNKPENNFPPG